MSVELVLLDAGQLNARVSRVIDYLDHFGDVRVTDDGARRQRRRIEWLLAAPGEPDAVDQVVGLYREYYDRHVEAWVLAKYTYDYLDKVHSRRFAYHMHPLTVGGPPIPHAHCDVLDVSVTQGVDEDQGHFRATEVELMEANQEFMAIYASGHPPDCAGLRPLQIRRDWG